MTDTVCCSHCQGTGRTKLTGVYAETLKVIRRLKKTIGYVVANQHADLFGCNPTALSNRLAYLHRHGLIDCEIFGRQRRYRSKS